jgi:hypothetical protein
MVAPTHAALVKKTLANSEAVHTLPKADTLKPSAFLRSQVGSPPAK